MNKEYTDLVNEAKELAIKSMKHFYKLLNLDPDLLNYLNNIPIKIEKTKYDNSGEYLPKENYIIINTKEVEFMLGHIHQDPKNKDKKNLVLANLAVTIIHEMLHANRTVLIDNGLNASNISDKLDIEIIKHIQEKKGHDLNQYRMFLSDMLNKPYASDFKTYIPIKVKKNEDKTYTVIAYNRQTKNYDEFTNQKFKINQQKETDALLHQIGIELNEKKNNHQVTDTIYTFINNNKPDTLLAKDYYYPYLKSGRIVNGSDLPSKDISTEEYIQIINKKTNDVIDRFENADGFEEIITETLADIIIMSRKKEQLDLKTITTTLYTTPETFYDVKIGAKFIQKMGPEMIKWFLTSAYQAYYNDEMEKIFQEKYDDLLLDFNDIYGSVSYEEKPSEFSISDIDKIVDEKVTKKHR